MPSDKRTIESIQTKFLVEVKDFTDKMCSKPNYGTEYTSAYINMENRDFYVKLKYLKFDEEYIGVGVHGFSSSYNPSPSVIISLLNTNKKLFDDFDCTLFSKGEYVYRPNLIKLKNILSNHIESGTLRLVCTITIGPTILADGSSAVPKQRFDSCLEALNNFKKLFDNKDASDVVFRVEGKEIYVQKNVLSCKSPVFAAMFSGDNVENTKNEVDIVDNTYDSMHALLKYIYTGVTEEHLKLDCKTCLGVLVAAEKYNLEYLKEKFQEIICGKLDNDNVFKCLVVADTYNAAYLKREIIDHIVYQCKDTVKSPKFKEFLVSNVDLSYEIIEAMATKIEIKS